MLPLGDFGVNAGCNSIGAACALLCTCIVHAGEAGRMSGCSLQVIASCPVAEARHTSGADAGPLICKRRSDAAAVGEQFEALGSAFA
jgi:hypothetical protein